MNDDAPSASRLTAPLDPEARAQTIIMVDDSSPTVPVRMPSPVTQVVTNTPVGLADTRASQLLQEVTPSLTISKPETGTDESAKTKQNNDGTRSVESDSDSGDAPIHSVDPDDDDDTEALLWCRVTRRHHGELLDWNTFRCFDCGDTLVRPLPTPQSMLPSTTRDAADSKPLPQSGYKYSTKFLWKDGAEYFSQPWPGSLDLERERGKALLARGAGKDSVVEIATVVMTNLTSESGAKRNASWLLSTPSVGLKCIGREVIIHSKRVMDVLRSLISYYPGVEMDSVSLCIPQPYALFYHYADDIREFQRNFTESEGTQHFQDRDAAHPALRRTHVPQCDEETYRHLNIVREVIEQETLAGVRMELERHQQRPALATYSMLWLLFKPGTKVYVRRIGGPTIVGVVLSVQGGDLNPETPEDFSVDWWGLVFDGTRLGRSPERCRVKPFAGQQQIAELEICPCRHLDEEKGNDLRDSLIDRGRKYWKYLLGSQVDYAGQLGDEREWVRLLPLCEYSEIIAINQEKNR